MKTFIMKNIKTLIIAATLLCAFSPAIHMYAMDLNNEAHAQQINAQESESQASAAAAANSASEEERKDQQYSYAAYAMPAIIAPESAYAQAAAMPTSAESQQDRQARTPEQIERASLALLDAARKNNLEAAKAALEAGADTNTPDDDGKTPVFDAINHNNIELLKILLDHGADVNHTDPDGNTPLHHDVASGSTRIYGEAKFGTPIDYKSIKMLVFAGADIYASHSDSSPLDFASICKTLHSLNLMEYDSILIKITMLEAHAKRQQAFEQLNTLKAILQKQIIQNPHIPVEDLAKLVVEYAMPYHKSIEPDQRIAFDVLNECVAQKWIEITKELATSRLSNQQSSLPTECENSNSENSNEENAEREKAYADFIALQPIAHHKHHITISLHDHDLYFELTYFK